MGRGCSGETFCIAGAGIAQRIPPSVGLFMTPDFGRWCLIEVEKP